jgi:hypothetical protein
VLLMGRNWTLTIYRNNTILSAPKQMAFGLMVGDEPWWNAWNPYMSTIVRQIRCYMIVR